MKNKQKKALYYLFTVLFKYKIYMINLLEFLCNICVVVKIIQRKMNTFSGYTNRTNIVQK